ncbi:MAG: putative histidine kinase, hybrid, partial [Rhizobacter sp.]|nr:putative histidine kinase, hybrid [Rhizobacter sp.]
MWLVTAILLPVFAVALAGVLYVYKEERASVDRSMRETTRALALVVDREIARREAILKTLATAPDLDREDFASFSRLAKSAAPSLDATIILSDLNGQQLVNSRIPAGQPLPKRVMFNQMREGGNLDGTLVSNLYESPMSRQFSFAVQVPVKRDGEVRFHLTLANHAAQLQPVWSDQRLPQAWIGAVVDKEGKLVARNRDVDRFLGRSASPDMVRSMAERPDGFIESTTLDGISTVSFFSRAPSSGWGVIIGVPRDEVMRSASRAVAVLLAVALVLLGGGLVAAAWVGRTVVRPVRALAQG